MWKYSEYVLKIYFDEFLDTNRFVTNGIQFKSPNNKFLVCFALILLVDVKSIPLAGKRILLCALWSRYFIKC